jgi:quercetin dioxygenase-like cupin family protein
MNTKVLERPYERESKQSDASARRDPRRPALALLAGGSALMVAAAALATSIISGSGNGSTEVRPPAAVASAPVAEPEFPDVGVAPNVYEPGHTSGWHTHPGLHSAVVLSGTLTIYEADCSRHDYGPGDTYLGGRDPHVARNDTAEPVQLVVTYVFQRVSTLEHATVVAPPAGCDIR